MAKSIQNALNEQAMAVKVDFEVTVQTWNDPASFTITTPSPYMREIGTNDAIYSMLNAGTKAHTILPKRGKTLRFPGTEARNWDTVIAKKWRRLFARQMQRAIDAAAH